MAHADAPIPAVVELDHNFFKAFDDPLFRNSAPPEEKPVFCAKLGEQQVSLPIGGIIRELALEDGAPQRVMLETIAKSLRFVTALRFGDDIPAEVRTGDASWEPDSAHREVARQRLTMQLVTWMLGRETTITDAKELQRLFDDPATKHRVSVAFKRAAETLGVADPDAVAQRVDDFATELSYVEALRVRFVDIRALFDKINRLRRAHDNHHYIIDEIDPVIRLMKKPIADFQADFASIDAETGEIMTLLNKPDAQRDHVRQSRDELFVRFQAWQDIVEAWRNVDPLYPQDFNIANGLRDLYRFLARRYMEADEWVLMSILMKANNGYRYGGVMTW